MLTNLFYFLGLFFIWREIKWIVAPSEQVEYKKEFDKHSKLNKGKKWDTYSKEYKDILKSSWSILITVFWLFIGIFTVQWFTFLVVLLFNIIIIAPLSKIFKYSFAYLVLHWINSLIGLAFGLFVIINHYHLHIDVWSLIKPYLS